MSTIQFGQILKTGFAFASAFGAGGDVDRGMEEPFRIDPSKTREGKTRFQFPIRQVCTNARYFASPQSRRNMAPILEKKRPRIWGR